MTIDEAIAKYKVITNTDALCPGHCNIPCEKCVKESEQLVEWLEKLKTIESIMLTYNANWYADEDNGVPDCEVLESIWNVIQDNGLDIDIEQDYRKGKADGYNKAIDDIKEKLMQNGFIYTQHALDVFNEIAEQLKSGGDNEGECRDIDEGLLDLSSHDAKVRADTIDNFVKEICKMIVQSESNGNYRFYAVDIKQAIADLAEQLKAGDIE